ncbi:MAG TPA: FAD-binding oxidoreductase [Candidatus Binatia bacterium]|nr:FAD-binding oxidoreductase [Candidatus Binatia bacterium]
MAEVGDRQQFAIDGLRPQGAVYPETVEQVSQTLRAADEQGHAIVPVGYGAFLHLGGSLRRYDLALSLQRLERIVDYQPTDMTVTVEAGLTLARLQKILGEHGQWLPIDPPLPEQATIGGVIAANLSGPMRLSQGTVRDFLIGLKIVQADGTVIKGGGRVVKNVAGYDLPKLYCGSFGTLGVIVEATVKVRPRPEAQVVLSFTFPSVEQAIELALRLLGSELQPSFLELANFDLLEEEGRDNTYRLIVGFAGIAEEVAYQRARVRELIESGEPAIEEWQGANEQTIVQTLRNFPVSGEALLRYKTSLLPTRVAAFCQEVQAEAGLRGVSVRHLARAGNGIVYSRVLPSAKVSPEKLLSLVDWLRILTKKLEGYMVIEAIDPMLKERVDVWGHVGGAFPLMKRLKETLDPHGILNPGRFVGGI